MNEFIDIHAHLDMLEDPPDIAIAKAQAAGVTKIITIGTEPTDHEFVLTVARKYYPTVYCTLGVHPHQAGLFNDQVDQFINAHAAEAPVVAIGEIGLDYYKNETPKDVQKESLRRQLQLAERFHLPVEIHTRDAEEDTVEILREFRGRVRGVIHCFTGTTWLAQQCLDIDYNISFSGIITFKNAQSLRDTCQLVPLDRLHVETDAPFLAPVPMRGKKNTPAYVPYTAAVVAELHKIDIAELSRRTNENARQLFTKIT